jgi:signal peptidase II
LLWILAAGGSNLVERLLYGCVGDYLKVPFFPIFNIADVVLSLSVVFLLWKELRGKE